MKRLRILVGCEYSGVVRDAFSALGHDAWSCDILPTEAPGQHIQGDVLQVLGAGWDAAIFHPPCTHLAVSGARWFPAKRADGSQQKAINFFMALTRAPIPRIAIENPVYIMSSHYRKPDQVIQPFMFGDPYMKTTCLWLKNLPPLRATNVVEGREQACWRMPPGPNRWKERSKTYPGIAQGMAAQWSQVLEDSKP